MINNFTEIVCISSSTVNHPQIIPHYFIQKPIQKFRIYEDFA